MRAREHWDLFLKASRSPFAEDPTLPGGRACPLSVTRPSGGLPDPWLCGPVSRRECLYREGLPSSGSRGCMVGATERPSRVRERLNSGNCGDSSTVVEFIARPLTSTPCRISDRSADFLASAVRPCTNESDAPRSGADRPSTAVRRVRSRSPTPGRGARCRGSGGSRRRSGPRTARACPGAGPSTAWSSARARAYEAGRPGGGRA